jgi:DNA repair exonuclease SbcCD nuclease subunit
MELFSILGVGDLHLGRKSYDLTERIRDHAAVLPQINQYVDEHRPDLLCILGDVFNAPNVDSFSCDAFRRFVEEIPIDTPVIALTGNHDREKINLDMTFARSLGGIRVFPNGTISLPSAKQWHPPGTMIRIQSWDWMPAAAIARRLEEIVPGELDILCIHQSVEGLMPAIGEPEVRLDQLRGKARLVLAGDLHVNKTLEIGPDTTLISCGSTEMCSADEDPAKVVKLIQYDAEARRIHGVVDLPLRTRPIYGWNISNEGEFDYVRSQLAIPGSPGDPNISPLHIVAIATEFAHRVPELAASAREAGALFVSRPIPTVEMGESFAAGKESAALEIISIIGARHQDEAERAAALALWRNPENLDVIIESLP